MKMKCRRLLSLLLVFVLMLGLVPSVCAATDVGTDPTTEPTEETDTSAEPSGETEPPTAEVTEATDSSESTNPAETTGPTDPPEESTEATEPIGKVPVNDPDEDWTQPSENDGMTTEDWDQLRWDALSAELPAPYEAYFPFDPSIQSHTDSPYVLDGSCTSAGLTDGKLISDEAGLVEFSGLHPERLYRLTETKAPDGYNLLKKSAFEGELPVDDLTVEVRVTNVRTFTMPKTGASSGIILRIASLLAALGCVCLIVTKYRKKKV